jgi:hypothetical protein
MLIANIIILLMPVGVLILLICTYAGRRRRAKGSASGEAVDNVVYYADSILIGKGVINNSTKTRFGEAQETGGDQALRNVESIIEVMAKGAANDNN